jgi:hypothetical protein
MRVRVMVFNTTFNYIPVISWWSDILATFHVTHTFFVSLLYFLYRYTVYMYLFRPLSENLISGVIGNNLTSSVVDRGFKPWAGQTKDYYIGIC